MPEKKRGSTGGKREARGTGSKPVRRQTVTMSTLDAIRDLILRGEAREGTPLRQDALAAELGVSRIPVREALRQLESEGLVTISPHVGAIVSTLSLAEIEELFETRALIEVDLLRHAMPSTGRAEVERAADILDRYEQALSQRDVSAWGSLNFEFHSTLYEPARRPLTMGIIRTLHNHSDRYLRMQLALTHGETRAKEEHREILAAVRIGDSAYAQALLNAHILHAGRSLLAFLRERADGAESDVPEPVGS